MQPAPLLTGELALLRLLQLTSPALPVGAFAYSQGLEWAVNAGWVIDEESAGAWIGGLLEHAIAHLEIPLLARLHAAWCAGDGEAVVFWNARITSYNVCYTKLLRDPARGSGGPG